MAGGRIAGEGTQSGLRVFIVNEEGALSHRFYALGELPKAIVPAGK